MERNKGGLREFREFAQMVKLSRTGADGILCGVIRENRRNSRKQVIRVHSRFKISASAATAVSSCRSVIVNGGVKAITFARSPSGNRMNPQPSMALMVRSAAAV